MAFPETLERKLHTNVPPTKEEAAFIRTALTSSLTKVTALEGKMLQLQNKQNELICEKERLSAFVKHHRALLAPIRRLLPEILQEIFYHCLPTAHNALMSDKETPLLLGRVCSRWRQIAYSTPKLWASIHIIAYPSAHSSHPLDRARQEAIVSWLSRSGALPLSISMFAHGWLRGGWYGGPRSSTSNSLVQPYLDLIIHHARRWKYVFLTHCSFDWTDVLDKLDGSHLPMLQSLHIEGNRPTRRNIEPIDIRQLSRTDSILSAPSLRIISFTTFYSRFLELPIAWDQITGLNLGERIVELSDVYRALKLSPNLEFCCVSVANAEAVLPLDSFEMAPLTLSRLRSLQINVGSRWDIASCLLLEHLTTPALVHFSYKQPGYSWSNGPSGTPRHEPSQPLTSLCSFLKRLTYPLEELEYVLTDFSGASALKVLPLVPNLKRLSLKGFEAPVSDPDRTPPLSPSFPMNDFVLSHLIPHEILNLSDLSQITPAAEEELPAQPCFCPKLEVLDCVDATFSRPAILNFIRTRTVDRRIHDLAHLRRVSISLIAACHWSLSTSEENIRFKEEIKALEKGTGVLVNVRVPGPQIPLIPNPTPSPPAYLAHMGVSPPLVPGGPGNIGWSREFFGF